MYFKYNYRHRNYKKLFRVVEQKVKLLKAIANNRPEIVQRVLRIVRSQSGRQDSNLRPNAPNAIGIIKLNLSIITLE